MNFNWNLSSTSMIISLVITIVCHACQHNCFVLYPSSCNIVFVPVSPHSSLFRVLLIPRQYLIFIASSMWSLYTREFLVCRGCILSLFVLLFVLSYHVQGLQWSFVWRVGSGFFRPHSIISQLLPPADLPGLILCLLKNGASAINSTGGSCQSVFVSSCIYLLSFPIYPLSVKCFTLFSFVFEVSSMFRSHFCLSSPPSTPSQSPPCTLPTLKCSLPGSCWLGI